MAYSNNLYTPAPRSGLLRAYRGCSTDRCDSVWYLEPMKGREGSQLPRHEHAAEAWARENGIKARDRRGRCVTWVSSPVKIRGGLENLSARRAGDQRQLELPPDDN